MSVVTTSPAGCNTRMRVALLPSRAPSRRSAALGAMLLALGVPAPATMVMVMAPADAAAVPIVQSVRYGTGPQSTRVVLDLSARPAYHYSITTGEPPAVMVEIEQALLAPSVDDIRVGDGLVERIRLLAPDGEGRPVQALIELTVRTEVNVFFLPAGSGKPRRLVIDVARPASLPEPEPRESREPEVAGRDESGKEAPAGSASDTSFGEPLSSETPSGASTGEAPSHGTRSGEAAPARTAPRANARKASPAKSARTWVVVIDPGHGGEDPGARGPAGLWEKDVCLALGKAIAAELNALPSIQAVLTRDSDVFLTLRRRTRIAAERKADLFVSVHANSNRSRKVQGTEVYFLSLRGASDAESREVAMRENAADHVSGVPPESQGDIENILVDLMRTSTLERSSELATSVIDNLRGDGRLIIRGVKQAGFDVLKTAGMPSILIESAFISHAKEARLLKSRQFHKEFGQRAAAGIVQYLARAAAAEARSATVGAADPVPPVPAATPPAGS